MSVVGDHLADELAPILTSDFQTYINAVAAMFGHIELYATDQGDEWWQGAYSNMLDVDNCPAEALPYLAQFVGVVVPVGTPEAAARALIRAENRQQRGTPDAIRAAAQKYLTGTKYVNLLERNGSAYRATLFVREHETPPSDWYSGTNIVPNPSFEVDTTGWFTSGGFVVGGNTIERVTTDAVQGTAALQVDMTAADTGAGIACTQAVAVGDTFTVSFWAKGLAGGETVGAILADAGATNLNSESLTLTTTWTRYSLSWTSTATASEVHFYLRGASGSFLLDGVQIVAGSYLPDYFDGSSPGGSWTGTPHESTSTIAPYTTLVDDAIQAVKPAGIVLTLGIIAGEAWDEATHTWDTAPGTWTDTLSTNI